MGIVGIPGPITDGNPFTLIYRLTSVGPATAHGFKGYLANKILGPSHIVPIGIPATFDDYEFDTSTVNVGQDLAGRVAVYDWGEGGPGGPGAWGAQCGMIFTVYVAQKAGAIGFFMLANPKDGLNSDLKFACTNQALLDAINIPVMHGLMYDNGVVVQAYDHGTRLQARMTAAGPDNLAFEVVDATNELTAHEPSTGEQALIGETSVNQASRRLLSRQKLTLPYSTQRHLLQTTGNTGDEIEYIAETHNLETCPTCAIDAELLRRTPLWCGFYIPRVRPPWPIIRVFLCVSLGG